MIDVSKKAASSRPKKLTHIWIHRLWSPHTRSTQVQTKQKSHCEKEKCIRRPPSNKEASCNWYLPGKLITFLQWILIFVCLFVCLFLFVCFLFFKSYLSAVFSRGFKILILIFFFSIFYNQFDHLYFSEKYSLHLSF